MLPVRDQLPTRSVPIVNFTLIALNVLAMGLQVRGAAEGADLDVITAPFALVPALLVAHPLASLPALLGHMFLHGSIAHLGGNMLFLWIFGDNVEDALGHARYAVFYLACGVTAALVQVALWPASTLSMVGASGAIAGVLAAYGALYPRSPIKVVNPIPLMWLFWGLFISLPAWVVILEFFLANLYGTMTSSPAGGIAFGAHVGGFVAGLVLARFMRVNEPAAYDPWQRFLGPRLRGAG